jgi:fructose-specific phosphotransferase system IIC component
LLTHKVVTVIFDIEHQTSELSIRNTLEFNSPVFFMEIITQVIIEKIFHFLATPTAFNINLSLAKWTTGMQGC